MSRFNIYGKKGVTLIELIIVLAILGVVIAMAFSLFSFGNTVFRFGSNQFDVQSGTRIASQFIDEEIRYAADISIVAVVPAGYLADHTTIPTYENFLYYDAATESVVKANHLGITSRRIGPGGVLTFDSASPNKSLYYTMSADSNGRTYQLENTVFSLNLSLGNNPTIQNPSGGGSAIQYRSLSDYISGTQAPVLTGTDGGATYLEMTFSKTINTNASYTRITDQGTNQSSRYGTLSFPSTTTVRIGFTTAVQNNRDLDLEISFPGYDGSIDTYAYTIKYFGGTWTVQ